jgi:hypothetical protein
LEARAVILTCVAAAALMATAPVGADDHALRFTSGQRHEVGVGLVMASGDQYTVETWIRIFTDSRVREHGGEIFGQHADGTDAKGTLDMRYGKLRFLINTIADQHHELLSDRPVPLGVWTHVAGVYDGAQMKIYINAQQVGQLSVTGRITQDNKRRGSIIGGYAGTAVFDAWFSGDIDETRIWDVARTQNQLLGDMFHEISPQTGLIGYWRYEQGGGDSAVDLSGSGHHGTLTNYRGSGEPAWVPGVFTQIDTLERRRLIEAGSLLPTLWIDSDMDAGDQGRFTLYDTNPGDMFWLQLHVEDAPQIHGWSALLDLGRSKLRVVDDSFQLGDFVPGASGRIDILDVGLAQVTVSSASGLGAGNGFLGVIAIEVLEGFAGRAEIVFTELGLDRADGSTLKEHILSRARMVSWPEDWPLTAGDPLPLSLPGPDLVSAGDTVSVPLVLDVTQSTYAVGAFEADIRWPADQLVLVDVHRGVFGQLALDSGRVERGRLTISSFNTTGTRDLTGLAVLRFAVLGLRGGAGEVRANMADIVATAEGDFRDLVDGAMQAIWKYEIDASNGAMGDVDRDGQVTIRDALIIAALATTDGLPGLPEVISVDLADVDLDGRIGIRDALMVATFVVDPENVSLPSGIGSQQETLSLANLHAGDRVLLQIEPEAETQGYRLDLAWDANALRLVDVHPAPEGLSSSSGSLQLAVMAINADDPLTVELQSKAVTTSTALRHLAHAVNSDFSPGRVVIHSEVLSPITAVVGEYGSAPAVPELQGNHPNPFNASTTIRYTVSPGSHARLLVYDLQGQLVCELSHQRGDRSGTSSVTWDGRDQRGRDAASGVYLCQLVAAGRAQTPRKMLLLR